jgi:hypothetical protein
MSCLNRADKACGRSERCETEIKKSVDDAEKYLSVEELRTSSGRKSFSIFIFGDGKSEGGKSETKSAFGTFQSPHQSSAIFPLTTDSCQGALK